MPYDLPSLPYGYDALEPVIERETMELHHSKHHRAYVDALNRALEPYPAWQGLTIEQLLSRIEEVPVEIRAAVRNQGGGHANHQLFWKVVRPGGDAAPSGALAAETDRAFGSFEAMKGRFDEAGAWHFGSGWVFLVTDPRGRGLDVVTTPDQDSVLLPPGGRPALLANDLWEHAYYLDHRNRRADYLREWWRVVNWGYVGERLDAIRAGGTGRLAGPAR
ncbi:superoxide dismutase [Craurococcus roseus]|uniref:Superoxide dismutase n=1 Tax=Craurococcus roseus TaxID=77585 RepID=A0ABP3QAM3_9PROT